MATRKAGKPYIWTTWLAKLLGGDECLYSAWFKAHYKYDKVEEEAANLVDWNREHSALMKARQRELEREGYTVYIEDQNSFKLEGQAAIVAGKPDIVAVRGPEVLVVDGKTGKQRDSDLWQVLVYLFALPKARPDLVGEGVLSAEVHYKRGDERITIDVMGDRQKADLIQIIKVVGGDTAPKKVPSRRECKRCNIGSKDCPERVTDRIEQQQTAQVGDF